MTKQIFFSFIFTISIIINGNAQTDKKSDLYKTIISKDSLLFNLGFNKCDISQFENLLSEKFEFFHDIDGISDRKKFLKDLRNGLCGNPSNYQARRELLPESTEIFALHDKNNNGKIYAAIQTGVHQFFEKQKDQAEKFGSSARFTHFWTLENGEWKLSKSFSYEHIQKQLETDNNPIFDNDEAIEKWLRENKVPTVGIGIIESGKLKQIKVFGEITKGVSAPYNTIFNVASLTKPVTAIVALKLVSSGKWDLDEPLYKYWTDPDIINDSRNKKLTTRLILSHQTGFPNWRWMNDDKKLNFQFDPGTKYQYSGEGLEYLRKALEKKFKKSLQQLASELIFEPLKMYDTRYVWDKNVDISRLVIGYDKNGKSYETLKNKIPNAADDLLTTIEDYGKFLVSVINSDGLSEQVFTDMASPQVASKNGKHFGLGFEIYNFEDGNTALSHGGADNGVQTIAFIFPKTKQGLLIFTNVDDGYKIYEKLLTHYLGDYGNKIIEIETK
ncbi:serine hydrolase [Flavobacterium ajazii]|uniref:serine hydrolase n=1 Tax=Flavobacterium ajazii TaxID=2692318 RepID=UPI0013D18766|nr:serine hydrolase [Flavobacterium ajazii]